MKSSRRWLCLAALVACATPAPSTPVSVIPAQPPPPGADGDVQKSTHVVRGRVVGYDGNPLELAHAFVLGADGKPTAEKAAGPDGAYVLPLAEGGDRVVRVQFTGVDHRVETMLVAAGEAPVDVTMRLGTYRMPAARERLSVILFLEDKRTREFPMTDRGNGTYFADLALADGKHGYEIKGLSAEGHIVNGTFGESYEYDGDGDYMSMITVTDGKAHIEFDPKKRAPSDQPSIVAFAAHGASEGLTDIHRRVTEARFRWETAVRASPDERGVAAADALWTPVRRDLATIARTHKQPLVRQAATVAYFSGGDIATPLEEEKTFARTCLDDVKPTDPLWSIWPALANVLDVAGIDAKALAYEAAFVEKHPDPKATGDYVIGRLREEKDLVRARTLYAYLQAPRFEDTSAQREARLFYDPERAVSPGKSIGAFSVKAIVGDKVDAARPYTPRSFAGKVYLIDLWATWCGPCVAEMPRLHEVFAKYANSTGTGKKLSMLSVSLDQRPEDVATFRKDKAHPMPWQHAFVGDDKAAIAAFVGPTPPAIPLYILVDEQGKILASSPQLTAQTMPGLVERALR